MGFESLRPSHPPPPVGHAELRRMSAEATAVVSSHRSGCEGGQPSNCRFSNNGQLIRSKCFPVSKRSVGPKPAQALVMSGGDQRFVYILRSESAPTEPYIGRTSDLQNRLQWHNHGPNGYTRRHRPWKVVVAIEFLDERTASQFERYLKSGSGRAFAKRHFNPGHPE